MKLRIIGTVFGVAAVVLLAASVAPTPSAQTSSAKTSGTGAKPLLLEKSEGEQRVWRDPPPGGFTLKVSPKNNGSQHLVFGTEDMAPGDEIPTHKHLGQDEIVYIETGTVHVRLGDQERDLHAGGMVFIPAYTWVNLKNTGSETASLVFVFSAPAFENHLRCMSVPAGQKPTPMTKAEQEECDREGHVVYKDREGTGKM
ncbi:MAG: cupin domain-containing protein [Candidatus Acidiferrales bacterium]